MEYCMYVESGSTSPLDSGDLFVSGTPGCIRRQGGSTQHVDYVGMQLARRSLMGKFTYAHEAQLRKRTTAIGLHS